MIIRAKSPMRVSFAGGGTDVSPFCEDYGGSVVNVTLNKYAWATLKTNTPRGVELVSDDFRQRFMFNSVNDMKYDGNLDLIKSVISKFNDMDSNFSIFLRSDVPPRSGLGSSASAFVSVIGLFNHLKKHERISDYEIAELAFKLEREELRNAGGRQDQYATVFGGLNQIEFKGSDFVRVNPLRLKKHHLLELEKHMVLVNLGKRKDSGDIIKDQVNRYKKGKTEDALLHAKDLAEETKSSLLSGDFNRFGKLIHEAWETKKKYSPMISNKRIDEIYDLARKHGALGGKISGAGGGGHAMFYCEPNKEQIVARKLTKAGVKVINFSFDFEGLQTWEVKSGRPY